MPLFTQMILNDSNDCFLICYSRLIGSGTQTTWSSDKCGHVKNNLVVLFTMLQCHVLIGLFSEECQQSCQSQHNLLEITFIYFSFILRRNIIATGFMLAVFSRVGSATFGVLRLVKKIL